MPYINFTDEQKERANSVDLPNFLERQGETLERSGSEWRWVNNRGVTVRGNEWYNHYDGRGGGPVQFVQEYYDKLYPEAVNMLLNGEQGYISAHEKQKIKKERALFMLPERNDTMRRVFAYLMKQRCIDGDIISHFAHERTLYEDKDYHNAIFVGCDENGVPKHAQKKGTYSIGSYRGDSEGSDPRYCFRHIGSGDTLRVFEAPVDMLSYITMHKMDWKTQNYVTLGGVTEHAMLWVLEMNPHITKIRLCLDHDQAGIEAAYRLAETLGGIGYDNVEFVLPINKDWNEDRKSQLGHDAVPSKENPKIEMFQDVCSELAGIYGDINPKEAHIENIEKQVDTLRRFAQSEKYSHTQDILINIYALSLVSAADQMKRIGKPATAEQFAEKIVQDYAPHKDRGGMRSRCDDISRSFRLIQEQEKTLGVRITVEREKEIENYVSLARECAQALSFLRLEEQYQEQTSSVVIQGMSIT